MASSDSNVAHVPEDGWARHYVEAAARRRARGWHRRDDSTRRRGVSRPRIYAIVGALFIALTIAALLAPR
jgi:hypothetical protein